MDRAAYSAELRRIRSGPGPDESIPGIGTVRFVARCDSDAEGVLRRAKAVMETVVRRGADGWNNNIDWHVVLPREFVEACGEELTEQEEDAWLARWQELDDAQCAAEELGQKWSLNDWIYWFEPENRTWQWWDAQAIDDIGIAIAIAVDAWPFPWGALDWLFRGSGATSVEAESSEDGS